MSLVKVIIVRVISIRVVSVRVISVRAISIRVISGDRDELLKGRELSTSVSCFYIRISFKLIESEVGTTRTCLNLESKSSHLDSFP